MSVRKKETGFTLIELSIVLVIIGLLVGGVMVGRDLIHASEVRAQVSQFEKFNTAVKTFKLKYQLLPGDMTFLQARQFSFTNSGGGAGDGNSNGLINDLNGAIPIGALLWEPDLFFVQLSEASLIEGKYSYVNTHYYIGEQFPPAKIGTGGILAFSLSTGKLGYFFGLNVSLNNDIHFSAISTAGVITPYDASTLDLKMDDGIPTSGRVRSATVTASVPAYDVSDGTCSTASTSSYNVTSSAIACRLIVTAD